MLKNLFIARSPLQLLNAIEAKEHFHTVRSTLLLIHDSNSVNSDQMKSLSTLSSFNEIIHLDNTSSSKISKLSHQYRLIKKLQASHYDYVFTGDYGTINQIIIANLQLNTLYLLDDGTMTLVTHKTKLNPNHLIKWDKKFKLFRYKLFGLKTKHLHTVHLFTGFALQPHGTEKIVANSYNFLKTTYLKTAQPDDSVYLLGQPMTQAKLMSDDTYVDYLKRIIRHYNKTIIYVPHRTEIISENLKALVNEHFILQQNEGPIEIVFLTKRIYPMHVIGFYSTALFNLKKIFETTLIEAIKFDNCDLLRGENTIQLCYSQLRETGIPVIELLPRDEEKK